MKPLTIVLAESGIELVPRSIQSHSSVISSARKRNKNPSQILLDISLHYRAMKKLNEWYKRGRPDIVHISLLNAFSSPLNIAKLLRVYIHTYDNRIIHIDPSTRIPRNYNRFVGLMEQLLLVGKVPPESANPLIFIEKKPLSVFISEKSFDRVLIMHEKGDLIPPSSLGISIVKDMKNDRNVCIIIGAFQHGDFRKEFLTISREHVSIFPKPLDSWIVVSRVIEGIENTLNIYASKSLNMDINI
ncbi:MAG: 16S rRNA methyltransferase [Ignisphaera sp.]|uniref:Ribosomal RNA small subunit methyltransferase Nep1 n=1 Tax=Ignisphaera aggregans TaxID=334771 RepID=A0A7J3MY17_9CREN